MANTHNRTNQKGRKRKEDTHLNILQINLNHCRLAHNLLQQNAVDWEIDAAIWITERAAMRLAPIQLLASADGYVAVRISDITVVNCYSSPNIRLDAFVTHLQHLDDLMGILDHNHTIVAGNFNAKSPAWGSAETSSRGTAALEMANRVRICPVVSKEGHTYNRNGRHSLIDIMLCGRSVLRRLASSTILNTETAADHLYIRYVLTNNTTSRGEMPWSGVVDVDRFFTLYNATATLASPFRIETAADIDSYIKLLRELVEKSIRPQYQASHRRGGGRPRSRQQGGP
ncbi:uncharacterized protein LOC143260824 [Megalopta genalis]|uniref:uncharacterized protein LOC143260824 n=1 Tax=Megalopta genalis TaxID=115081 RepID=UPI003FD4A2F1